MVEQVSRPTTPPVTAAHGHCDPCGAERHTKVNCVTVAMGDVVVEHSPRVGELLTPTGGARARGADLMFRRVQAEKGKVRRHVCDAAFTYDDGSVRRREKVQSAALMMMMADAAGLMTAKRRRALLKLQAPPPTPINETFTFETIEVVLPKHQNHMGHRCGVVMSWMHKAARTCCAALRLRRRRGTDAGRRRRVLQYWIECERPPRFSGSSHGLV